MHLTANPLRSLAASDPGRYVLMPFDEAMSIVYEIISTTAEELNISCARADKQSDIGMITQSIIIDILLADIIVADISMLNPNVLYELGISHTFEKPTLILSQELSLGKSLPFDITNMLTISYKLPVTKKDRNALKLSNDLRRYFNANRIYHNPVSITTNAIRINLANNYRYNFLWGYEKTLSESVNASVAWIVSKKLYWERLDNLYNKKIFEERILLGKRKELVILPDTPENRTRKKTALSTYREINPNIDKFLQIMLIDNEDVFSFISTEIVIYDPNTPQMRGAILEPMAVEGVDDENDFMIAQALLDNDLKKVRYYNLKENTFDLSLPKVVLEIFAFNFKSIWNNNCLKMETKELLI